MTTTWQKVKIGDVCSSVSDTYHRNDKEVVLINTSDVFEGKILNNTTVKNQNIKGQFKKTFKKGDILYSEIRPANKRFAFVDIENTDNYIASTKLMVLRSDTTKILPEFLYAILKSDTIINKLQFLAETRSGTFPQITFSSELAPIKILLPTLDVQKKIAGVLSALDDKIELNNQINSNLEQQAQALFKSWFIDFEPFGGKMPNDWKQYKIKEFVPVITGKKNANVSSNTGKYPFFSCSQTIARTNEYSFNGRAILVAGNGDFNVKFYDGKFEAYQRTYVLIPYQQQLAAWLFYAIKYNLNNIISSARGSVISFITKGSLEESVIAAPRKINNMPIMETLSKIADIILHKIKENQRLSEIRDSLLPKLMSGEIDMSKVDISDLI